MLITSQSNHKLHTTAPLFPRCLTFTFSPLNHQQPLSSFFHPLSSNEDMYRSFLWWLFKNSEKRSFSEFFVDVFHNDKRGNYPLFYGFVSTTGALNILVLATSVSQLALRDLAWLIWAVFSRPMNPWSDSVLLWNAFVKFWVWFHETLNAWSVWDFGSPRHSSCWMMLEKTIFVDAWPFG